MCRTWSCDTELCTGVVTDHGTIECEYVVNAAGMWARQLGAMSGVSIPLQAAEHYYLITEQMDGLDPSWPVIEDPGNYGYYREEVGGLMIGLFEAKCAPWKVEGIPHDSSFTTLQPDWDRMGEYVEAAMSRVPLSMETGIRTFFCGPESFTPDLRPIVGEAPEVKNYFVAAGLNSIGILTGGGLGRLVAHWIVNGRPDMDVTGMSPARLQPYQANPEYRRTRTVESLGMVYQCHYPNKSLTTARDAEALAAPRPARRTGCVLQGRQRLGEPRLVCRSRRHSPMPVLSRGADPRSGRSGRPNTAPAARASSSWT